MRKELRDISRDRRTLALALLLGPLLYPVLMLGMGKLAESRAKTQLDKVLDVPVIGAEHAPNLVAFLADAGHQGDRARPRTSTRRSRSQDVDVALRDRRRLRQGLARRPAGAGRDRAGQHAPQRRDSQQHACAPALTATASQVGALRLLARGIDPSVARPLNVGTPRPGHRRKPSAA